MIKRSDLEIGDLTIQQAVNIIADTLADEQQARILRFAVQELTGLAHDYDQAQKEALNANQLVSQIASAFTQTRARLLVLTAATRDVIETGKDLTVELNKPTFNPVQLSAAASKHTQSRMVANAVATSAEFDEGEFQHRAFRFATDCFGSEHATNKRMRAFRFMEEAFELAQACGLDSADCYTMLNYVFSRETGEVEQKIGGVSVALAVLAQSFYVHVDRLAEKELLRCRQNIEAIRAKALSKPDFETLRTCGLPAHLSPQTLTKPSFDTDCAKSG